MQTTADGVIRMNEGKVLTGTFAQTGEKFVVDWVEYRLGSTQSSYRADAKKTREEVERVLSHLRWYNVDEMKDDFIKLELTAQGAAHEVATTILMKIGMLLEIADADD